MFCIGLYASAIFLSQDARLRNFIRKSALEESKTLVNVGAAQLKAAIGKEGNVSYSAARRALD